MALSGCRINQLRLTDRANASKLNQKDYALLVSCDIRRDYPLVHERLLQLNDLGVQTLLFCPKENKSYDLDTEKMFFYKCSHQDREIAQFFTKVSLQYLLDFIYVTYQETEEDHYQKK